MGLREHADLVIEDLPLLPTRVRSITGSGQNAGIRLCE
jgi:hypothetical protein